MASQPPTNHPVSRVGGGLAPPSFRFLLACALYTSSIIIGAGILGLPSLTATVGLLPALGLTIGLGFVLVFVYTRIAETINASIEARLADEYREGEAVLRRAGIGPDQLPALTGVLGPYLVSRKGVGILDNICAWLGFGPAGKTALTTGLVAYVLPAIVLYTVSGGAALTAVAERLETARVGTAPVAGTALALLVTSMVVAPRLPRFAGRAALSAFVQALGSWGLGIALLMLSSGSAARPLPLLLFAAAIAGLVLRSIPPDRVALGDEPAARDRDLEPAHQIGTIIAAINLALLAVTAMLAIGVLWWNDAIASPDLVASNLDAGRLAKACGALLFAFTGTGVFNLIKYPALFGKHGRSGRTGLWKVVAIGTVIPTIAYAAWMLAIAFALSPETLIRTDNEQKYATVPLADLLTRYGPLGWIVFFTGLTVALMAVTSAGLGFSESLADRLARIQAARRVDVDGRRGDTGDAADRRAVQRAQISVLALGTALALVLTTHGEAFAFRDILSVAGYAGGGLLLLVLPFFIPTGGRRRSPKRDVAIATVLAIGLAGLNVLELPTGFGATREGTIAGSIVLAIDVAFVLSFLWLLLSEPPDPGPVADGPVNVVGPMPAPVSQVAD